MDRTANTPSAAMRLLDVQVCRARSVHRGRCVRIFGKLLRRRERLHCPTQTIGHRKIECTISKLVPQDSNELVAKSYSDEPTSDDLPSNWRVLNFGKFCDIEGGNQPPKSQFISEPKKGYVRLLQIRDLGERQGQLLWRRRRDATGPRQARCPRDRFACSCSSRSSVGAPAYRDHPLFGAGS